MNMMIGPLDYLSLREQLKLLEIAHEASDARVRQNAIEVLDSYRHPPRPITVPKDAFENSQS